MPVSLRIYLSLIDEDFSVSLIVVTFVGKVNIIFIGVCVLPSEEKRFSL